MKAAQDGPKRRSRAQNQARDDTQTKVRRGADSSQRRSVSPLRATGARYSSEYFFALPRAFSTGYFSAFFSIFSRAASSRFTSSLSAMRTR